MAEQSESGHLEAEAVSRASARLTFDMEGLDLDELDPKVREELESMLHNLTGLLRDGITYGKFPDALVDGIGNALSQIHDIASDRSKSDRDSETP